MTALEVRGLVAAYGPATVVRGIDLDAQSGRINLLLGANGAGKTSALRAIMGLLPPTSGRVIFDGHEIIGMSPHNIVRRGLVLIPQGREVFASLSVLDNLKVGSYTQPSHTQASLLSRVFDLFPILHERAHAAAGLLSGGEQQMLAFGRAMMSEPELILMDEPSMGLAPAMVEAVLGQARRIADSGVGILLVEQNAELGLEIADEVVLMAVGEVRFSGPASRARADTELLAAFLGESALVNEQHD